MNIDITALSWLSCARRFQFAVLHGFYANNDVLVFGSLCHKYAELWALRGEPRDPLPPQEVAYLVLQYTQNPTQAAEWQTKLLQLHFSLRTSFFKPLHSNKYGKPCVEYKFALPLWSNEDYVLRGTIDRIESYLDRDKRPILQVRDLKTDNKAPSPESQFKYINNLQLFMYMAVAEMEFQYPVQGLYTFYHVSLPSIPVKHSDIITLTGEMQSFIPDFLEDACKKISRIREIHESGKLAYPEGRAYNVCTYCHFRQYCKAQTEGERDDIKRQWKQRDYDPTTHGDYGKYPKPRI